MTRRWFWLRGARLGVGEGVRQPDTQCITRLTRDGKTVGVAVKWRGRWYGPLKTQEGLR